MGKQSVEVHVTRTKINEIKTVPIKGFHGENHELIVFFLSSTFLRYVWFLFEITFFL